MIYLQCRPINHITGYLTSVHRIHGSLFYVRRASFFSLQNLEIYVIKNTYIYTTYDLLHRVYEMVWGTLIDMCNVEEYDFTMYIEWLIH